MQHMVGAKLDCALGPGKFGHNSYSTSDQQSGRSGDFFLGDVASQTPAPSDNASNPTFSLRPATVLSVRGVS